MNVLDLFSGIGGFSLGLERAGMRTVAFCEIDPYCRAVLRKHWPTVPVYDDVRTLTAARLVADAGSRRRSGEDARQVQQSRRAKTFGTGIDLICGGFPCQDISVAGKGAGLAGERSGLWSEYARIIGEVRPRYVIVENVAALLSRGLGDVLGDLAALGYDAEWHCIPASAVGAPHLRDRLWAVAYSRRQRGAVWRGANDVACATGARETHSEERQRHGNAIDDSREDLADTASSRQPQPLGPTTPILGREALELAGLSSSSRDHWLIEPDVGRVAHGVPNRVDRLRALGNAVVPQIPEIIGRAIMKAQP